MFFQLFKGKPSRFFSIERVAILTILFFLVIFSTSCKRFKKDLILSEGIIEYSITYLDEDSSKYDPNIRPDRMVVRFKNNNTVNRIEALSGAFSFAFIQDIDSKTSTTLVKILNKKLFYREPLQENRYHFAYKAMPDMIIEKVDETESFLGFSCKKALATFNDSTSYSFEIWYTDDIVVNMPNHNTPFEAIDGIMLKFSVIMFNQKMNIAATSVKSAKLAKDEFNIPLEYEEVNYETMMELIYLFQ